MTSVGVLVCHEMILTIHVVTDEDGKLKISRLHEFQDSKTFLDSLKDIEEAKLNLGSASFAA